MTVLYMEAISVAKSQKFLASFFETEDGVECLFQWTDTLDLYLGDARFEFWLGLSWLRVFVVFLSPSKATARIVPHLGHNCFLPNYHSSSIHPFALYSLVAESDIK
jgi:hypothetical protein